MHSKSKPIRALGRSLDLAAPQQAWQLLATGSFPLRGNCITQLSTEKLQHNVRPQVSGGVGDLRSVPGARSETGHNAVTGLPRPKIQRAAAEERETTPALMLSHLPSPGI